MAYVLQKLHKEEDEKDVLTFIVKGNPITKKNSSRIIKTGNRSFIVPSQQYKEYEKAFIVECMANKMFHKNINYPCNFQYKYYMQTKRKVDLTNLISATDDCLQAAKVIVDDDCSIVVGHDGSRVYYDKENPRVEITISKIKDEQIFPNI